MEKFLNLVSGIFRFHTSPKLTPTPSQKDVSVEPVQKTHQERPSSENLQRRMMSFGITANENRSLSDAQVENSVDRMLKIRKEKTELKRTLDVLKESVKRRNGEIEEITENLRAIHIQIRDTATLKTESQKTALANNASNMIKRRDVLQASLIDLQNKIGVIELEISNMVVTEDNSASVKAMHHLNETRSLMMNQTDVADPKTVSINRSEIESRERENRTHVDTLFSMASSDMTQSSFTPSDTQTSAVLSSLDSEFNPRQTLQPENKEPRLVFVNKRTEQNTSTSKTTQPEREANTN